MTPRGIVADPPGDDDLLPGEPTRIAEAVAARLAIPCRVSVMLTCPSCDDVVDVEATLGARLVRDTDGTTTLALRTRAPKVAHTCGQLGLGLATGALVR